ncbi:MAG: hypothetical protein K9H14_02475 [Actinomycetia bacterium]|nr:hypothetical protein [Actinomycetes bacterium]
MRLLQDLNRKHNNTPFQRLDTTRMKLFLNRILSIKVMVPGSYKEVY